MPIYDYVCSRCGQRTEVVHGIHDPAPRFCPACGAAATLSKAITSAAIHYRGSGWAKKDRSAARSATKAADGATTDGGAKAGSVAEGGKASGSGEAKTTASSEGTAPRSGSTDRDTSSKGSPGGSPGSSD